MMSEPTCETITLPSLTASVRFGGQRPPMAPINVNEKFKDPDKTPLSVEVKDNPAPGAYDFKLTK